MDGTRRRIARWKRDGVAFTDPREVHAEYEELVEAAAILGRPDLARALRARVTPELCARHAATLKVLLLCAGNVLQQPLPSEPAAGDDHLASERQASEPPVSAPPEPYGPEWEMYDGGDTDLDLSDGTSEASEGSAASDKSGATEESAAAVESQDAVADAAEKLVGGDWASALCTATELCRPPDVLSHAQFVQEAALLLTGRPSFRGVPLVGVSRACSDSLWAHLAAREPLPTARSLLGSQSVIQLLGEAERAELGPDAVDLGPLRTVERWLQGEFEWPLGSFGTLPRELRCPELREACVYAGLARRLYGQRLPPVSLHRASSYGDLVRLQMLRNGHALLEAGLRSYLLQCWRRLAAVFLAQDARTLLVLDECGAGTGIVTAAAANAALAAYWPDAPARFEDQRPNAVPVVEIDVPPLLTEVFGPRLADLFAPGALVEAWHAVVAGFCAGDQTVEFAMADLARTVEQRIATHVAPRQYFS